MGSDLEFALELADLADSISMQGFRKAELQVLKKEDLTPVTEFDRRTEEALRDRIAAKRSGHSVVGEEFGDDGGGGPRWILDPIDGTKNYVRGIPIFATLIALERDGTVAVGVASAPALGRRWWAARGEGALADGKRIEVSKIDRPEEALLLYGGITAWRDQGWVDGLVALTEQFERTRGFGDFWMHMLVAEGAAEVALEAQVALWDLAAVQVIVEEAGGRFTDFSGVSTPRGGSALSTNGLLHELVLSHVLVKGGHERRRV